MKCFVGAVGRCYIQQRKAKLSRVFVASNAKYYH